LSTLLPAPELFTVAEGEAGERLDRFLSGRMEGLSRSRLKALIEEGRVSDADGRRFEEPSLKVRPGQSFIVDVPEAVEAEPEGQDIPLDVLYEDDDLIVIDKPAGLVVHPAAGNPDGTLVNALIAHCGESLKGIGGVRRPGIVHRLDKDTSGVMVAAKTEAAHQGLTALFAARTIDRRYLALAWGRLTPLAGERTGAIGRSPHDRKKMAVLRKGGRPAVTRYRSLRLFAGGAVSEVECSLLTGRTHQIRVHLAEAGHPLVGDPLYGRRNPALAESLPEPVKSRLRSFERQALHARTLGFTHPLSGKHLFFESKPPSDMRDLIAMLEQM